MPGKKSDNIKNADDEIKAILQENIIKLRKMHGLTQKAVSDALGIKRETYSNYERRTLPPQYLIIKLSKIYNVTPDVFYRPDFDVSDRLVARYEDNTYGERSFTDLSEAEKMFIMSLRQLNKSDKEELFEYMSKKLQKK